jgi:hypothetical protein
VALIDDREILAAKMGLTERCGRAEPFHLTLEVSNIRGENPVRGCGIARLGRKYPMPPRLFP